MDEIPEELAADRILINGNIVTVDPKGSTAEALAVKDGRFLMVGAVDHVLKSRGRHTEVIDFGGKTILPGFIDCHNHVPARPRLVDLHWVRSMDELVAMLREKAERTPKGRWVQGGGFNESKLEEKRFPNRYDLDKASTEHPIAIGRVGGHVGNIYNSYALNLAGITRDTPDPKPPAYIERDPETGEPLGNLRESAEEPLLEMMAAEPPSTNDEVKEALKETFRRLNAWGITSVQEPGSSGRKVRLYQELSEEGALTIRNTFLISRRDEEGFWNPEQIRKKIECIESLGILPGFGDDMLRVAGLKLMVDGSMSAANAALYEPYLGQPDNIGIMHEGAGTKEEFIEYVKAAHKAGLRLGIHAIGDRAIDIALDGIEAALKAHPREDHRHSIEHCGLPTKEALERMRRLGVTASSSVGFGWELGDQHLSLIGKERMKRYYPHRSFLEHGIKAGANFDYSVTMADIMKGIYVMVARRSETGQDLGQNQRISRMDAIKAFTMDAAYLEFEEGIKGSIEPGKLADFVVLDKDILTCSEEEIKDIHVLATYLGGKSIYKNE